MRIYFGVGGPNDTSSFHVIGEIFDQVYSLASLTAAPLTDVQTITVPPGGATVVEFKVEVPGNYMLVDHALSPRRARPGRRPRGDRVRTIRTSSRTTIRPSPRSRCRTGWRGCPPARRMAGRSFFLKRGRCSMLAPDLTALPSHRVLEVALRI